MLPAELINFKRAEKPINILTAWDSISSEIVEEAGADVILVGDSLSMVILGHSTTLPVTLEQMLLHTQAVGRGLKRPISEQPLIVCDLPFLSYQCGEDKAVSAAGKLLKHSCAAAVKLEGAEPEIISVISRLIRMGIPVMGHLGLTPQAFYRQGYKKQAQSSNEKNKLIEQALALEQVGCFSIVLEHIPSEVAGLLRHRLKIPVIGIGAGDNCDGQVRVTADLIGLTTKQPPFSKSLVNGKEIFIKALKQWIHSKHPQADSPTSETFQ